MAEFERENRYIVIKRSDLDMLYKDPTKYATTFGHALALIAPHLPKRQFLVIESDWPEFEPAWRMIERRVSGLPDELAALREELASAKRDAERYRYLRDPDNRDGLEREDVLVVGIAEGEDIVWLEQMDQAVDVMMESAKPTESGAEST